MDTAADIIFHHGHIFTADSNNSIQEAIAIKEGTILAIGENQSILKYAGLSTKQVDLKGQMMMPGIVDCHMHPFWGGQQLVSCSLNYQKLTLPETLATIQKHLDQDILKGDGDWLAVRAWQRSGMLPAGTEITRADLDTLDTKRPVALFANNCHTLVANSCALELLGLDESVPEPPDGKINRDETGRLNGILEDAPAMRAFDAITNNTKQNIIIADLTQKALNQQGVTTVMDTRVMAPQLDAFSELKNQERLTLRFFGANEIIPDDAKDVSDTASAVQKVVNFAQKYNKQPINVKPDVGVYSIKLFIDGLLNPTAMSASLLEPYWINQGTEVMPNWQPSDHYGERYFSDELIDALILESAKEGLDIHLHTIADGAIEVSLQAIEKMRQKLPQKDIRPAFAHDELVSEHQYKQFAKLDVTSVLSLQWSALSEPQIENSLNMLGATRFQNLEPAAKFIEAGARVAYGSDWPIDPLDEWQNFQVGLTRQYDASSPRLNTDRNLTITEVLRAATIDAAYVVHQEHLFGSLEVGKFADLIVLNQNVLKIPTMRVGQTKVCLTMVGGDVVYLDTTFEY